MTDLPDFETVRRELETELEQEGLDMSAGPAVPVVGYEDVELLDTYSRQTPSGEERSSQPVVKSVLHNAVLKSVLHNPQMGNALFGGAGLVFFVAVLVFLSVISASPAPPPAPAAAPVKAAALPAPTTVSVRSYVF